MPHVNDLHEQHDPILVVSLASGDLAAADRDRTAAQSLVDTCADCARLHDDVLALAAATKALPPAVRTRDFRLTPEQAAQLQPGGWRRFFTAPGALFSRPLGVGLTTLGIAGILISSIGALPLGMASSAGAPYSGGPAAASEAPAAAEALRSEDTQQAPQPAASENIDTSAGGVGTSLAGSPPASTLPFRANGASPPAASPFLPDAIASPAAAPTDDDESRNSGGVAEAPAASDAGDAASPMLSSTDDGSSGPPVLLVVSSLALVAGVVVLLARRLANGARSA